MPERFDRAPELVGTFTVLLVENIAPDAPLHDRLHKRYRAAIDIITEHHRARSAARAVPLGFRCGHKGRGNTRLHQRNGDPMVTRSFNTAHRGVQGVRGVVGVASWRHGARHEVPARCGCSQRRRRRQVRRRLDVRPRDGRLGRHRAARRTTWTSGRCRSSVWTPPTSNRRWRCGPSVPTRRRSRSPPICSRATSGCAAACSALSSRA